MGRRHQIENTAQRIQLHEECSARGGAKQGEEIRLDTPAKPKFHSREEQQWNCCENQRMGESRQSTPNPMQEEHQRRAKGRSAEQRRDTHAPGDPLARSGGVYVKARGQLGQQAPVVLFQPGALLRRQFQAVLTLQVGQFPLKSVDAIHALLRLAAGTEVHGAARGWPEQ
ncbi:MAG: hypothetical protein FJ399_08415 [Verrucomicrobia bacterium]|nr:hypothetical protein [Verrucomicrobiota bacterium]